MAIDASTGFGSLSFSATLAPNTTFFLIVLCSLRRLQASIDLQSESRRPRSRQALRKRLLLHNVRSNANAVEPGRWSCKQC